MREKHIHKSLTIGILATGDVNKKIVGEFGEYPRMFHDLLKDYSVAHDWQFYDYNVFNGDMPQSSTQHDAWIITGSKHGVYENHDWIAPLEAFIRQCYEAEIAMVGICFGHQLIAQALGAKVEKSHKGWGLGNMQYDVVDNPSWLTMPNNAKTNISIDAVHQDQVMSMPAQQYQPKIFLRSEFCDYAGLYYGDNRMMSMQCHPEFSHSFVRALINAREFDQDISEKALKSMLDIPSDSPLAAHWIGDFINENYAYRQQNTAKNPTTI